MAWSYDVGLLATSPLHQVRRLIGDVLVGDQQLQDEEINWTLTRYSNIYGACAELCRDLATMLARQVDLVQGELKTNYSQRSKRYKQLADDFQERYLRGALPVAGGISVADKQNVQADPDRVPPAFQREQFDDRLPVTSVGEQTQAFSLPDTAAPDSDRV